MTVPYTKPAIPFLEQLNKLVARGLVIPDQAQALVKLESTGYYRLSGYCYPFRVRDAHGQALNQFVPNTSWDQVITLYEFDRHLRLLVLDAIERVEVAIRTQLTYHFSCAHGAFGHTDAANFHPKFDHAAWLADAEKETDRSGDKFIDHYKFKYEGFPTIPLWMLTEVLSLGSLSRLYRGLNHGDKLPVSTYFNTHHKRLADWLHTLTYIRNVCAHHSRLWNRELSIRPDKVKDILWQPPSTPRNDRIFYVLLILRYLQFSSGNGYEWVNEVNILLSPISDSAQWRAAMGIPDNWQTHPIWNMK